MSFSVNPEAQPKEAIFGSLPGATDGRKSGLNSKCHVGLDVDEVLLRAHYNSRRQSGGSEWINKIRLPLDGAVAVAPGLKKKPIPRAGRRARKIDELEIDYTVVVEVKVHRAIQGHHLVSGSENNLGRCQRSYGQNGNSGGSCAEGVGVEVVVKAGAKLKSGTRGTRAFHCVLPAATLTRKLYS